MQTVEIQKCDYAVFDLDKCLVDNRIAESVGKAYLKRQLYRLRLDRVAYGIAGGLRVKKILREGGEDAEVRGLEEFVKTLAATGIATLENMYNYAKAAAERHALPGARDFVQDCRAKGIKTYIATLGLSVSAKAAADYFCADDCLGNTISFDYRSDRLLGLKTEIRNGREKLEKVKEKINVKRALVVGNDYLDWPLMEEAAFSMATPLADEETKKRADYFITDFRGLHLQVRAL